MMRIVRSLVLTSSTSVFVTLASSTYCSASICDIDTTHTHGGCSEMQRREAMRALAHIDVGLEH
jgi:hypothetical protein